MKILVGADGSKAALHAVRYAAELLRQIGSDLNSVTLITVHDQAHLRAAQAMVGRDHLAKHVQERSEIELKASQTLLDAQGIRHESEIRTGEVATEIAECAQEGHFDLIVLGAKPRGATLGLLIGSVAQRVLASSSIPVMLVK
jgi:nucleotide-binding universal stress UspA family protein